MSYKHVMVAIDLGKHAEELLNKAANIAKNENALLSVIYVDLDVANFYSGLSDIDLSKREDNVHHELISEMQSYIIELDYPLYQQKIAKGDVDSELENAIKENNVDMLVIGHHKSNMLHQMFISATEPLIRDMPCDISLIKVN
ncbi:universal stress protein [Vibrio sp. SS-MA-C1-2]|uniref:universal stress protein n=1 Tax=Vibrio sp. SS-MA-C1-2 TaxID=2908646 RepID=UPI001F3C53DF|nr:universal stress protein [Vibrio sp. SS-MA-C1-2]UJF18928.1 universal stress protein [Vibrio sp. SS-MA-C1-2]